MSVVALGPLVWVMFSICFLYFLPLKELFTCNHENDFNALDFYLYIPEVTDLILRLFISRILFFPWKYFHIKYAVLLIEMLAKSI